MESNCGLSLNNFESLSWIKRAKLALKLLQAAENFTESHPDFRFYLTDISPDNIAVDTDLNVAFVDLGNVIVTENIKSLYNFIIFLLPFQ